MNIRGIEIELHEDEDLSNHIRRERDFFEAEILDYLRDNHPVQDTIIDVGANIGNHSVYFAHFLQYKHIICIEPVDDNFLLLIKNMAPYKNKSMYNYAAAATTRNDLAMVINRGNMGASEIHSGGNVPVKAISIDKIAPQNVSLMKIDVEGYEPAVLDGAQDTIHRFHPLILIEDWERKYDRLFPDYELEKAWPEHQTFLYHWRD